MQYTLYLDFPIEMSQVDKGIRYSIRKAQRLGYAHTRSTDMLAVVECLQATERRQGFRYGLSAADLEMARSLLGDEHLRAYVAYAPDGQPACAMVVLHCPGGRGLNWLAGGKREHLPSGAGQALTMCALEDLAADRAIGFDFGGANLPSVSSTKADWGAALTPYYRIEPLGLKPMMLWMREWIRNAPKGRGEEHVDS